MMKHDPEIPALADDNIGVDEIEWLADLLREAGDAPVLSPDRQAEVLRTPQAESSRLIAWHQRWQVRVGVSAAAALLLFVFILPSLPPPTAFLDQLASLERELDYINGKVENLQDTGGFQNRQFAETSAMLDEKEAAPVAANAGASPQPPAPAGPVTPEPEVRFGDFAKSGSIKAKSKMQSELLSRQKREQAEEALAKGEDYKIALESEVVNGGYITVPVDQGKLSRAQVNTWDIRKANPPAARSGAKTDELTRTYARFDTKQNGDADGNAVTTADELRFGTHPEIADSDEGGVSELMEEETTEISIVFGREAALRFGGIVDHRRGDEGKEELAITGEVAGSAALEQFGAAGDKSLVWMDRASESTITADARGPEERVTVVDFDELGKVRGEIFLTGGAPSVTDVHFDLELEVDVRAAAISNDTVVAEGGNEGERTWYASSGQSLAPDAAASSGGGGGGGESLAITPQAKGGTKVLVESVDRFYNLSGGSGSHRAEGHGRGDTGQIVAKKGGSVVSKSRSAGPAVVERVDALADDLLRDLVPAEVVAITQLAQKAPAVTPVTRPSTLWGRKAPLDKTKSLLVGGNSDHYFQEAKRVKETAKKQVKASGVTRNIAARDSLKEDAELVERGELWRNGSARSDTSSKENLDPTDGIEETTRGRSLLETISSIELLPGKDHPGSGQAKPEPQSLVRIDGRLMDLKKQVNVLRVEELDVAERLSSIDYIEAGAALTQDVNTSDVLRLARQKSSIEIERKELIPSGLLPMHPKIAALETDQEDVETPLATTEKRLEREQTKLAVLKEKTERPDIEGLPPAPSEPAGPVNPFVMSEKDALSTFALESEAASYVLSRRYLRAGYKPPPGIVRMEEFVNAFDYNYPSSGERTFSVHTEAALSPFGKGLTLLKVGVRGKVIGRDGRKPAHLVFVIDASGSMARPDRLPMVREALGMLVEQLGDQDRVSLISYASRAHLLLDGASASDKARIIDSLHRIECTAATNVLEGVRVGYQIAARHFRPNAVNRVILCSDGVANVGPNDADAMLAMVNTQRRQGIAITTVGVGAGSYNDGLMEQLANRGDGNYVYIDSLAEAHRVFVENFSATLNTIARDVKIQVAFDPKRVRRYRLIGYENRKVKDQDFRNDKVDAGEIGSGQSATALYELELHEGAEASDLGTVFVRYKENDGGEVQEFASRLRADLVRAITPAESPRFFMAAAVAEFAEILRQSPHAQRGSLRAVEQMLLRTSQALPQDSQLAELLQLVRQSQDLPVFGE